MRICALVARQVGVVLAAGVAAGLGLALAADKVLAGATYGVAPGDPLLLAASAGLLAIAGLAAALVPAKRAAAIQPLQALRHELGA